MREQRILDLGYFDRLRFVPPLRVLGFKSNKSQPLPLSPLSEHAEGDASLAKRDLLILKPSLEGEHPIGGKFFWSFSWQEKDRTIEEDAGHEITADSRGYDGSETRQNIRRTAGSKGKH